MPVAPVPALDQRLEALVHAVVLPDEDSAAFCHSLLGYLRRYQPADAVELSLVEEMAVADWRLRRAWRLEAEVLSGRRKLSAHGNDFAQVQLYETRLRRASADALARLLKLRRQVPAAAPARPAPPEPVSARPEPPAPPQPAPEPQETMKLPNEPALSGGPTVTKHAT
jgi:hypothetical protein